MKPEHALAKTNDVKPNLSNERTKKEDATCSKSNIDRENPRCARLLMDKDKSMLIISRSEVTKPTLAKDRKNRAESECKWSKTDNVDSNLVQLKASNTGSM